MKKQNETPLKGYRKTGSFSFDGKPVEIWIHSKTGSLVFVRDGQMVQDAALQDRMMETLQKANKISRS